MPRVARGRGPARRAHTPRSRIPWQRLLQLPHAEHGLWAAEGHTQSWDHESECRGERRGGSSQRLQSLPSRQVLGMDLPATLDALWRAAGPRRSGRGHVFGGCPLGSSGRRGAACVGGMGDGVGAGPDGVRRRLARPVSRRVPRRSLRGDRIDRVWRFARLDGFQDRDYDSFADRAGLRESSWQALEMWHAGGDRSSRGLALLISEDGQSMQNRMRRLERQLDDRPLLIAE